MPTEPLAQIHVLIPAECLARTKAEAKRCGETLTEHVWRALRAAQPKPSRKDYPQLRKRGRPSTAN
jgi:hypothetical protein